ncbi:MAG: hypothetical protein ACI4AM_02730 [Muribaculaceae bacterium]
MANKLFLFAIGGTGERVLRSFTMLLASGVPTFHGYDIYPIIIDYDKKNEDKNRTVELLKNYAEIQRLAYGKIGQIQGETTAAGVFFDSKLVNMRGLEDFVYPFKPTAPNMQYREYIGYDTLVDGNMITKELLESLYYTGNDSEAELNLNMEVGFKGNPNIGSVVFNTISNEPEFQQFLNIFDPQNGDKVVVIGSIFGGTGASGIPEIIKAIKTKKQAAQPAAIVVLPYFSPETKNGGTIKAERFNSKTKAALNFYEDSGIQGQIQATYYVGDFYPTVVPYAEGGTDQRNNANVVELIAAMMIEDFVSGRNAQNVKFKFSINANLEPQKDGQNKVSNNRIFLADFDTNSQAILYKLAELAIGLKFFHDDISSKRTKEKPFYDYLKIGTKDEAGELVKLRSELSKFYTKYQEWFEELDFEGIPDRQEPNSHRMALCDMTRSYTDIILTPPQKEQKSGWLSRWNSRSNTPTLEEHNISPKMNARFDDSHYDIKENQFKTGHNGEWAFIDMLWYASEQGLKTLHPNHPKL